MKVIHVFSSLGYGGVETHAVTIAKHSVGDDQKPIFCALNQGGAAADKIVQHGCKVKILGYRTKIPNLSLLIKLIVFFREESPDVVHAHGGEANFHGLLAAFIARVPVRVGEEIGIPTHSKFARMVFKSVYSVSSQVVAISDSVKDWLIDSGEVGKGKVTRIYNPVDKVPPDLILAPPDPDEKFRLTFVGRLEPVKNPLSLIAAVPLLLEKGVPVELWLVGDGSLMEECLSLCSLLKVEDSVKLKGYSDDPFSLIVQSNLYVQPSITEGFGIALVEAMICKTPVLATSVGGAPEIINHGSNGWLTEHTDAESLASSIYDIWCVSDQLRDYGLVAYDSVKGRFDPLNYMAELKSLYLNLGD
ncbi:MAG: glycosyltransferase [Alcanivorax sp.]|uniref:glycosyltransferase n=1 Tax=Alcanivorax sp. TaxID=1872427 RepID=UPI003C67B2A1